MTTPTLFKYDDAPVRVLEVNGEPAFVANDLCKILDIRNARDAIANLDDDEKGVVTADTLGGPQSLAFVSEAGMYSLVLRSRKPEAKAFKRWLTHEVIPQIRKTGAYVQPTGPELMALALQEANRTLEHKDAVIGELSPKADAWDHIVSSAGSWSFNDAAKVLFEHGVTVIGEKRLVKWLVDNGFLYRDHKGRPHAYQPYIEQGLLVAKARTYPDLRTGETRESSAPQVRITGKGLDMLFKRFRAEALAISA